MGSVPVLKPREVVACLERLGFVEVRQRGSHRQFGHPDGRLCRADPAPRPAGPEYRGPHPHGSGPHSAPGILAESPPTQPESPVCCRPDRSRVPAERPDSILAVIYSVTRLDSTAAKRTRLRAAKPLRAGGYGIICRLGVGALDYGAPRRTGNWPALDDCSEGGCDPWHPVDVSPTVFRAGGLRFYFFSREEPRVHVHAQAVRGEAKFWLDPEIELAQNYGLSGRRINRALQLIREHEDEIRAAWKAHFGR